LKKRPSPHFHKVLIWSNKVSPWTLQMALIYCNNVVNIRQWFMCVYIQISIYLEFWYTAVSLLYALVQHTNYWNVHINW
jgi:hypothetical protein